MDTDIVSPPLESPRTRIWGTLALLVLTLFAYLPAFHGGYIWDDDYYVTENEVLRTGEGLKRIWLEPRSIPQYYPLVHSTFWIEYQLWELDPLGYHLVNVLFHVLAAVLLWMLLGRLGIAPAWLVAALFALHPVHVESVAWITERKNVLSGVFYVAALLALAPVAIEGRRSRQLYLAGLALFVAALLSKSVTCSLPAALLLLVYWKRGRLAVRDLVLTAPMFVFGLAAGLHTAYLERVHVGAGQVDWDLLFVDRVLIAGRALWFYAGKLLWPEPLIFNYPRWQIDAADPVQWLYPAAALAVVAALFFARSRIGRGPLVAVLFFGGTLFPALGFVDVYPMIYSFVADHFQYLASLGLIVLGVAGVHAGLERLAWWRPLFGLVAAVLLVSIYMGLTFRQSLKYWDAESLWRATIEDHPGSWMARDNLARRLQEEAREAEERGERAAANLLLNEATAQLEVSLELHPDAQAYDNLAQMRLRAGRHAEAAELLARSLELEDEHAPRRLNRAIALGALGREEEQRAELRRAVEIDPDFVAALRNLAVLYLTARSEDLRDASAARELATRASELTERRDPWQLAVLAEAEAALENWDAAATAAEEALDAARHGTYPPALAESLRAKIAEYRAGGAAG